jgi:hypothetical protein
MPSCHDCGKFFSSTSSYKYHASHQVCSRKKDTPEPKVNVTKVNEKIPLKLKVKYTDMSRDELMLRLSHVEGKYEALKETPQNVQNNIIVFPASFGKEDMDHIQQTLGDILKTMITQHPFKSIPLLFDRIHNSQQLPEYHNVYVSSERSNYAMVSDGKNFKYKPKKTIIDQIIEDKRSILNRYVDENGEQLGDKVLNKYEKYQNQLDDNSEFRKSLEVEIGGLLLDMKSVIADDEKTRQLLEKVNDGQYELTQDPTD